MYALDFEYDGVKLSDYGMMICSIDSSSGVETVSSGADLTFNQLKTARGNKFPITSAKYDEAYVSEPFQICKNPCYADNEIGISSEEISAIQRWLCRKDGFKTFKIDQKGYEHIYWNGTFSSKQITLNGRIIGLELTLYTDSPYAYMDEVSVEYDCSAGTSFDFYDNSDEVTDMYNQTRPDMEITILSNGDFTLSNSLDSRIMILKNCKANEVITINGDEEIITSSLPSHKLPKDFNFYFPRVINTYEERCNSYTPSLDCKIKITYSPSRKVGL